VSRKQEITEEQERKTKPRITTEHPPSE